jgi:curli biogenesis system outer membrane secretion channel CsgG
MKTQVILTIAALLLSAAVTAQTSQPAQSRDQKREQAQTHTRTQDPVQVQTQDQYKNQGQMVSDQKHARNQERKVRRTLIKR